MNSLQLAYLVFETRSSAKWERFMQDMLGLPAPIRHPDGSTGWAIDAARQRLLVVPGARDDLQAVGLQCESPAALASTLQRLRAAGLEPVQASEALRHLRGVQALWCVQDPQDMQVELCLAPETGMQPFASAAFADGFETGDQGLGHVVLASHDLPTMEAFYVDLLGFGVTERLSTRVGPIGIQGTFLHCNRRHHSLALFDIPSTTRIHHFMLQARTLSDVGLAFERAVALKLPIHLDLGQHPAPDGTFSFYAETPSGFAFEIGAHTHEIEPVGWQTMHTQQTSSWGHKPRLRLQLKMAWTLLAQRLRAARALFTVPRPARTGGAAP